MLHVLTTDGEGDVGVEIYRFFRPLYRQRREMICRNTLDSAADYTRSMNEENVPYREQRSDTPQQDEP